MSVEEVGREVYRHLRALVEMPEDSFAIFDVNVSSNRYVQFASLGDGGLWGEVVSNQFLEPDAQLPPEIEDRILGPGWHPPESPCAAGSETEHLNYYREWPAPDDFRSAACLAAITLGLFGVDDPNEIAVELGGTNCTSRAGQSSAGSLNGSIWWERGR